MYSPLNSYAYIHWILDFKYILLLYGNGRADHAAIARIRNGWMKYREILPFQTSRAPTLEMKGRVYASCVRSSMTYRSETRPLLVAVRLNFEKADMLMLMFVQLHLIDSQAITG